MCSPNRFSAPQFAGHPPQSQSRSIDNNGIDVDAVTRCQIEAQLICGRWCEAGLSGLMIATGRASRARWSVDENSGTASFFAIVSFTYRLVG
jgi:hypothetical protein